MSDPTRSARRTAVPPLPLKVAIADVAGSFGDRLLKLTEVQRRCLELTLEHMSSKEIAQCIGVTPHSVDWHMKAAMRKLGVDSRVAAALVFRDHDAAGVRQGLAHQSPEVVTRQEPTEVESSFNRWSDDNAFTAATELRDAAVAVKALAEEVRPSGAVQGARRYILDVGVPWGALNTLQVQQRLLLIVLIASLSALAFGSIIGSLEALRHLL